MSDQESTHAPNQNLDIRYDQSPALYTSQFMVRAGDEEVSLDCISSVDTNPQGATVVPVHTQLALSWGAVERLASLLNEALAERHRTDVPVPSPHFSSDAAKLPSFGDMTSNHG